MSERVELFASRTTLDPHISYISLDSQAFQFLVNLMIALQTASYAILKAVFLFDLQP